MRTLLAVAVAASLVSLAACDGNQQRGEQAGALSGSGATAAGGTAKDRQDAAAQKNAAPGVNKQDSASPQKQQGGY